MSLYSDKILNHAKHPKRFGRITNPDLQFEHVNPLCGDRIRVEIRWTEERDVLEAKFSGEMCAIAKASASILFESLEGLTPAAIIRISDQQVLENLGGTTARSRVNCALLPVVALRGALQYSYVVCS
ncbi:MAG: iron-sulfur cluster assembly scaffold protein [Candidatus Binatia bacterium]